MANNRVENQSGLRETLDLEDFLSRLAHKLNNQLTPVIGCAQLLALKTIDPETKKDLTKIIEGANQASQVIKDLVDFLRERKPQKEVADLNDLIETVLERTSPELASKNICVLKELTPSIPFTLVDPKQIGQVLLEFIHNAEEAISEFHGFGKIMVKTRAMEGQLEIIISDDGPGISAQNIFKIFDPFFTTKRKGLGLGLAISHDMLTQHGGTMKVESEWGKGAAFTITLPIIEVEAEKKKEKRKSPEKSLKGMKGLVIDDEPAHLDFVSKYLELEGCEISTASDGKKALNVIKGKDFDFIICDMKMPEMDGSGFYRTVREKKPALSNRIIFSTGDAFTEKTRVFLDSVANRHIEKPFNLKELKEVIALVV